MNIKKSLGAAALAAFTWLASAGLAQAQDDGFNRLVIKWTTERDALVVDIVRSWLRGASADSLKPEISSLVGLESRLAVQGDVPLYMTSFTDGRNQERLLAELVRSYLKRRSIQFQTRDFFVGKEFKVLKEERPVLAEPESERKSKFRFQLWGTKSEAEPARKEKGK